MYDTILLPTDGSEATNDAAAHAFSLAERYDATVHVLSVVEISSGPGPTGRDDEKLERLRRERTTTAERLVEDHAGEDVEAAGDHADEAAEATVAVRAGSPARVIDDYATDVAADLVVMSTRAQGGARRFIFGSVTEQVIQAGETPVLAVQR